MFSAAALFKAVVILLLVIILVSLATGMLFLVKDKGSSERTVKSLTVRIALSVLLFALLIFGFATGLIEPHGIQSPQTEKALQ